MLLSLKAGFVLKKESSENVNNKLYKVPVLI